MMTTEAVLFVMDRLEFPRHMTFVQAIRSLPRIPSGLGLDDQQVQDQEWLVNLRRAVINRRVHISHLFPHIAFVALLAWHGYKYPNLLIITPAENLANGDGRPSQAFVHLTPDQRSACIQNSMQQFIHLTEENCNSYKSAVQRVWLILQWCKLDMRMSDYIDLYLPVSSATILKRLLASETATDEFLQRYVDSSDERQSDRQQAIQPLQESIAKALSVAEQEQSQLQALSTLHQQKQQQQQLMQQQSGDIQHLSHELLNLSTCAHCQRQETLAQDQQTTWYGDASVPGNKQVVCVNCHLYWKANGRKRTVELERIQQSKKPRLDNTRATSLVRFAPALLDAVIASSPGLIPPAAMNAAHAAAAAVNSSMSQHDTPGLTQDLAQHVKSLVAENLQLQQQNKEQQMLMQMNKSKARRQYQGLPAYMRL